MESARAANVDLKAFGHDMRRLMQLPATQKITKKFLRETMTMAQYNTARKVYGDRLAAILSEDVPNHEPPEVNHADDSAQASMAQPASPEDPAAVPSPAASSSAPDLDPAAAERDKLQREVATWDLRIS